MTKSNQLVVIISLLVMIGITIVITMFIMRRLSPTNVYYQRNEDGSITQTSGGQDQMTAQPNKPETNTIPLIQSRIRIVGDSFSIDTIRVKAKDEITIANTDTHEHTIISLSNSFPQTSLQKNETTKVMFEEPGDYYISLDAPNGVKCKITVEAGN